MLKPVQHDKKKCVIPNLFRNLDFGNDNKLIAFVLVRVPAAGRKFGRKIGDSFRVVIARNEVPKQSH